MDEIETLPTKSKIQRRGVFKSVTGVVLWLVTLFCVHVWSLLFYVWDFRQMFIAILSVLSAIICAGCIEAVTGSPCPRLTQEWKDIGVWHRAILLVTLYVAVSMLATSIVYVMWLVPTSKVGGN